MKCQTDTKSFYFATDTHGSLINIKFIAKHFVKILKYCIFDIDMVTFQVHYEISMFGMFLKCSYITRTYYTYAQGSVAVALNAWHDIFIIYKMK